MLLSLLLVLLWVSWAILGFIFNLTIICTFQGDYDDVKAYKKLILFFFGGPIWWFISLIILLPVTINRLCTMYLWPVINKWLMD